MINSVTSDMEIRKWRNAFYGLPVCYKPEPMAAGFSCNTPTRPTNVDAKSLWASVARARKARGVMA